MVRGKFLVLFSALVMYAFGITNMDPPRVTIDSVEEEYNSLGGVKNITDWFALMPSVIDFDADKNSSIDELEY